MADRELNCKGLMCPMPIVKTSREAKTMTKGQILKVEATDSSFKPDIEAWCKKTGNLLESLQEKKDVLIAEIKIN